MSRGRSFGAYYHSDGVMHGLVASPNFNWLKHLTPASIEGDVSSMLLRQYAPCSIGPLSVMTVTDTSANER